jgi:hypothetical protein
MALGREEIMRHVVGFKALEQADSLIKYYEELLRKQKLTPQTAAAIKSKILEWKRIILR